MYQALYRKWRPRTFDDVVGQAHITETLKKQVETGRLSHAYLFVGTRGTGKTTCAKILARAVNCEHPISGNPCNECAACRGIESGRVMDVVELDAASNNGVDNVRALRDEAIFTPASVKKRVYIIDEVHMLSSAAFNALLKILEEPPEHLMFILCTTELRKVLPTIISRCQRHSFKRLSPADISARLQYVAAQERMDLTDGAADMLARLADGGMRDGLSLLDQCSASDRIDEAAVLSAMGLSGSRHTAELLDAVCAGDVQRALGIFDGLWNDGKDPAAVLDELSGLMRDILLTKIAPNGCAGLVSGAYAMDTLQVFSDKLSADELMAGMDSIRGASAGGSAPRQQAELCLIGLCVPELGDSLPRLRARLARLERALETDAITAPAAPGPMAAPRPEPVPEPASEPASEPVSESISVQEPEPEPVPESAPEPAAVEGEDFWKTLVNRLRGELDIGTYSLLTPPSKIAGRLSGNVLTVTVQENPFVRMILETSDVAGVIGRQASALAGQPVSLRFEQADAAPAEPDAEKLDSLSKFPNVTYET